MPAIQRVRKAVAGLGNSVRVLPIHSRVNACAGFVQIGWAGDLKSGISVGLVDRSGMSPGMRPPDPLRLVWRFRMRTDGASRRSSPSHRTVTGWNGLWAVLSRVPVGWAGWRELIGWAGLASCGWDGLIEGARLTFPAGWRLVGGFLMPGRNGADWLAVLV